MSDDVTITEDGTAIWIEVHSPAYVLGPARVHLDANKVAALRAHFAAERLPEDVQALVDEARSEDAARPSWEIALDLADALEAAYSQKGAVDDPR